ncbi:GtrA family protein [Gammaproteobacteria bacterium]|jgi:putative flippase GtrA|nr:GtrA family protein [Gammaproteobacteria bacterium]
MNNKQFLYFLISGGFAAALNILSRVIFSNFVCYEVAIILAYIVGITSAFLLMRNFVFDGKRDDVRGQAIRFIFVNILAILQTVIASVYLNNFIIQSYPLFIHAELVAHMIGVLVPVITSFFAHKWYTFRKNI